MPNLKDIRRRIKSVKNTQKITLAMKMVAAAKVKRAETRVKAIRPYAEMLQYLFSRVLATPLPETFQYASLFAIRPVKRVAVLAISADRGLCGAYHASVMRQFWRLEEQYRQQGIEARFYLVGSKLAQAYKRYGDPNRLLGQRLQITAAPQATDALDIATILLDLMMHRHVDQVELVSSTFVSMISSRVQHQVLLPFSAANAPASVQTRSAMDPEPKGTLLIEPSPAIVLESLIPQVVANQVYQALLEASASEHASRMTAMSNATKNAGEMMSRLTVQYNKARQASITQEILEVVSGAQALG